MIVIVTITKKASKKAYITFKAYIYIYTPYNVHLLTSVNVVPLMKNTGVS